MGVKKEFKFSIITPCYNSEEYIRECIESVRYQSYRNFEHIIVDGASTDHTMDIVRQYDGEYPMYFISEKDSGMYDAVVKGFQIASGDIFCWLNSDDMFSQKGTLEIVNQVFGKSVNERGGIQWLTGIPSIYDEHGVNHKIPRIAPIYSQCLIKRGIYDGQVLGFIQQESTFWTKELWVKAHGEFIKEYQFAGDYHLWKAFAEFERLYTVNCVLSGFRKHGNQKSSDLTAYKNEQNLKQHCMLYKHLLRRWYSLYCKFAKKGFIEF